MIKSSTTLRVDLLSRMTGLLRKHIQELLELTVFLLVVPDIFTLPADT